MYDCTDPVTFKNVEHWYEVSSIATKPMVLHYQTIITPWLLPNHCNQTMATRPLLRGNCALSVVFLLLTIQELRTASAQHTAAVMVVASKADLYKVTVLARVTATRAVAIV